MSAQDETHLPRPGDVLAGKYRIERVLGKGGMGVVYAAHHEILAQRVAVKVLLSEIATNPEAVARFLNEARSAARIESDHVARVMDVGTMPNPAQPDAPPMPYIVMEFLEGVDLAQLLEMRGPLALTDAVDHVLQALEALAQAHLMGIVHRDLKPANLFLVNRRDGNAHVKVLDFGISKVTNPFAGAAKTNTSSMLGTPYYMSPEQMRNAKDVDPRADIWSIGVVLHELLAGAPPFGGETLGELLMAIVERDPPPLQALRPDLPAAFDEVVWRCLRKDPAERYDNVAELASALAPFASSRGAMSAKRVLDAIGDDATKVMPSPARRSSPDLPLSLPPPGTSAAPPALRHATAVLAPSPSPDLSSFPPARWPSSSPGLHQAATAGSWAGTHGGAKVGSGRGRLLAAAAVVGALVVLGAAGFGVRLVMSKHAGSAAVAPSAGLRPSREPAPPMATSEPAPEPLAPPASVAAAPSPSPSPSPALVAPTARAVQPRAPLSISPAPSTRSPAASVSARAPPAPSAPSAPKATPNCDPNYTLDSSGGKHFKPECFQ